MAPENGATVGSKGASRRVVSVESSILAAMCLADLISTLILVQSGLAVEANPLLAQAFRFGPIGFAVAKLASFLIPLAVVEYLRPRNPVFCARVLRIGIVGYLAIYIVGTLHSSGLLHF